ncbi:hypothetical protein [Coleofasciculus sp. E1-EBD-02]|uniref:hypothetical protein n=1 Tax=Coleofasciculus sp. E1-EBD-02 TaxID=3068481 RepID=UPI003301D617
MNSKNELDTILAFLEKQIKKLRLDLRDNALSFDEVFSKLQNILDKIINTLGLDTELENKRRIYGHIANFLRKRFNKDIDVCKEATYILCQEDDPRLLTENFPSVQATKIASTAKEHLLAIKVYYNWLEQPQVCQCKTEIFSHKPGDTKPVITRVEEELTWELLPDDVRATFIRNNKKDSVGFELYP